jgi:Predicted membrane protein (DUF2306)
MTSRTPLATAGATWLAIALAGQALFAGYVLIFYGGAVVRGDWAAWNEVFPRGYAPGDHFGNVLVASHVAFTVLLVLAGAAQLLPAVRSRVPTLHRISGRVFVAGAVVLALGGLGMMLHRGAVGDATQHLALAGNAMVLLVCAVQALRHARARRFAQHRRWALRLWVAFSGVWFFRIGLALWLVVHGKPVGFDPESFSGPFLTVLAFGQYIVPLALLEVWLRTDRHGGPRLQAAVAVMFGGLALVTFAGVAAASLILWLPRL